MKNLEFCICLADPFSDLYKIPQGTLLILLNRFLKYPFYVKGTESLVNFFVWSQLISNVYVFRCYGIFILKFLDKEFKDQEDAIAWLESVAWSGVSVSGIFRGFLDKRMTAAGEVEYRGTVRITAFQGEKKDKVGNKEIKFSIHLFDAQEKFGGDLVCKSYEELEAVFSDETLHPMDLKNGAAKYINEILDPVREVLL